MNNILNFGEYTGTELEQIAYDNVLNEKSILGGGLRGFFNKRAAGKIKSELAEEIELSKSIMEGIQKGLEEMNKNFDAIKKSMEKDDEEVKGEKQKSLDEIIKIIEDSRKKTWDLNELIDEGEIDYTGFTANVAISSVAYFGILLTPFRATVMIHKGYNYFFNIVKNTIRKSLVMLQLNFDQFENLIITQSMRCAGVITASDTSNDIGEFYGSITAQLAENKSLSKAQLEKMKTALAAAKQKFDQTTKADKLRDNAENLYNNLSPYDNTYTKSLEALRQYSADDVQKHLDAIKTSMGKLAGQEADLQTFSELILAAAEEHAYAVSSSIYNKFAKMTEVFSLPNQQKMIDLILDANKEKTAAAKKLRQDKKLEKKAELEAKAESDGIEIFKSIDGVEIGEMNEESKRYDSDSIKRADEWTYEKFNELDDEKKESLESWLRLHPEVVKECDKTLQVYVNIPLGDTTYIDSLIDYIGPSLIANKVNEEIVLNFDEYLFEAKVKSTEEVLKDKIRSAKTSGELISSIFLDKSSYDKSDIAKLDFVIAQLEKIKGTKKDWIEDVEKKKRSIKRELSKKDGSSTTKRTSTSSGKYYLDFSSIKKKDENLKSAMIELYSDNEELAKIAFEAIGIKVLNDNTFVKNSASIVEKIKEGLTEKKNKVEISNVIYELLKKSITKLEDKRNHDYESSDDSNTKKSEK